MNHSIDLATRGCFCLRDSLDGEAQEGFSSDASRAGNEDGGEHEEDSDSIALGE